MADVDDQEATRGVWRRGSYEIVGDWFADGSRAVLAGSGGPLPLDGLELLDVACGTGAVAIEAARRGARVTGLDLTPELLDIARRRAEQAGVEVRWVEGTFEDLSGLGEFDAVVSSFGVMFAADPPAVAAQLAAACRDDGFVGVAAWDRRGALGGPTADLRALLPDGGAGPDVTAWAEPDAVGTYFAGTTLTVADHHRGRVAIQFASASVAADEFVEHSGGWAALFEYLEAQGHGPAARRALEAHLGERSDPVPAGIAVRADYGVTRLTRR
ncbi:MAG: class I SAM-dependent methyltransferase [Actinomycetota bacterium]|nr:class I SAM-dependent methyltransferase [Actinomycetota bacterium]